MEKATLQQIHYYWKELCNDNTLNSPLLYLNISSQRERLVKFFVKEFFPNKEIKILELGCNVGSNLRSLSKCGYKNLTGIEINPLAVEYLNKFVLELDDRTTIYISSMENCIKSFADNQFDLVFTLAVLEHIHPDSEWIFKEITRITNGLITIEDETNNFARVFKRNYFDIFSQLGMKQKVECSLDDLCDNDLYGFMCRVFKKNA